MPTKPSRAFVLIEPLIFLTLLIFAVFLPLAHPEAWWAWLAPTLFIYQVIRLFLDISRNRTTNASQDCENKNSENVD